MLNCIDNSGAALVECALVVGRKRHASIGTNHGLLLPCPPLSAVPLVLTSGR